MSSATKFLSSQRREMPVGKKTTHNNLAGRGLLRENSSFSLL
jgi:hypothetical protein